MTEEIYDNPDAPEERSLEEEQAAEAERLANQPIVTAGGVVLPTRTNRSTPIASLIGKKDFGIEPLGLKDYYPTAGDPILVGHSAGRYIGNQPIYSGAGALYPYAIVDARRRALEQAAMLSKLQEEQARNVKHEPMPSLTATKSGFHEISMYRAQNEIKKIKAKYPNEAAFWKDYDARGDSYFEIQMVAKNTESFKQGVDQIFVMSDRMQAAEKDGKFVPKEYRNELNKITRQGADVADPEMMSKLTKLFGQPITENMEIPIKDAIENLSKRVEEKYADIAKIANRGGMSETNIAGLRLKEEKSIYNEQNIAAEAERILENHKAGAINQYTTREEREKYEDDEPKLIAIAKEELIKTITKTTPVKFKEQIEGSVDKLQTAYSSGSGENSYAKMQVADAPAVFLPKEISTREALGLDNVTKGKQDFVVDITYLNPKGINPEIELPAGDIYSIEENELGNTVIDKLEPLQGVNYFKPNRFRNIDGKLFLEVTKKTIETEYDPLTGQIKTPVESKYLMPATPEIKNKLDTEFGISVDKIIDSYKKTGEKKTEKSGTKKTSVKTIKNLVGKPGYEGYTEKELIEHYKKDGYQIE